MQELSALLGIVTALTVGVVSPGASFVLIARTAVSSSRSEGVVAALGMGAGGVVFAVAALLGLQGVLLAGPSLYLVLKAYRGWTARPETPAKSVVRREDGRVLRPRDNRGQPYQRLTFAMQPELS